MPPNMVTNDGATTSVTTASSSSSSSSVVRRRRIMPTTYDEANVPDATAVSTPTSSRSPSPTISHSHSPPRKEGEAEEELPPHPPPKLNGNLADGESISSSSSQAADASRRTAAAAAAQDAGDSEGTAPSMPLLPPGPPPGVTKKDVEIDSRIVWEFGGPIGVTFLMLFFPTLMLYLYICLLRHTGRLVPPTDVNFWIDGLPHVMPTILAMKLYLGFTAFQILTASTLPGIMVKGLPVPSLGGRQLVYTCNGVASWYIDLAVLATVHLAGVFDLASIIDNVGPIMSVAILWAFFVSVVTYITAVWTNNTHRMSGSVLYDMFMGAILNPRIGNLDLKMFAEIRIPWKILFLISLSAAVKDHQMNTAKAAAEGLSTSVDVLGGTISLPIIRSSAPILFMLLAHALYVNACMKGEECIPTTWDIFYEKWGFMLIYWNLAGVPFSYCYSTVYLIQRSMSEPGASEAQQQLPPVGHTTAYTAALFVTLMAAYYVWDTANSQKNRFRMQERGTYVVRRTFPQLPWGTLTDPTYIQTKHGNKLLTGGWWGVARKIHYTADLIMALCWGLITGFESYIPYFYFTFFITVLTHRVSRDVEHCQEKYGEDWDRYTEAVPYIFIPFVY